MPKTRLISPGSIPNHKLLKNLQLQDNYISNDGGDEGITIDNNGIVTMSSQLDIGNMSLTTSELDISSGDFTLDVADDIILDIGSGDDLLFKAGGSTVAKMKTLGGGGYFQLYESAGGTDSFSIYTATSGATTIGTTDVDGKEADLTFNADGALQFQTIDYAGSVGNGEDITLKSGGDVIIDKNYSHTTATTTTALHVDLDRTGDVSSGSDYIKGIDLDVNATGASNGNIYTTGMDIDVVGDAGGTSTAYGIDLNVSGSTTQYGIKLITDDSLGTDYISSSSANVLDKFTIHTEEDGETTLTTFEYGAGSTAHLNMVADGNFTVDAEGDITLDADGDNITMLAGGTGSGLDFIQSGTGDYTIKNLTSDKDVIFNVNDGGSDTEVMRIDSSESSLLIASGKKIEFGAAEEHITGDTFNLTIASGGNLNIDASGHVEFDGCGVGFDLETPTYDANDTDVNFINGNKQFVTFDGGNITDLNLIFPKISGNFLLMLKQDGTGSRTVTNYKVWDRVDSSAAGGSATVKFAGGSNPTLTTDANHVDIISFFYDGDNEIAYGVTTLDFQF